MFYTPPAHDMFPVTGRPLVAGTGTRRAPPPLSDQQAAR